MILWKFQISNIVTTQEVYVPQKGYKTKGAGGQINLKYLKTRVFWGFLEKYPKIKIFRKTPKKKGVEGQKPKIHLKYLITNLFGEKSKNGNFSGKNPKK